MSKRGFIRRSILVWALALAFNQVFFADGRFIRSPSLRRLGSLGLLVLAGWGQMNLLQKAFRRPNSD